jgi:glucose dehydrogenase
VANCTYFAILLSLLQLFGIARSASAQTGQTPQPTVEQNYQARPYQAHLESDDGQWTRPAKDYASTRYSSIDQTNTTNAKTLQLAFTFSTGMTRGHEAAPLIVNNTMYIVTPFPNNLHALDLTKPGAPMKWVYQPLPTPASQEVACCDVVNRGASYDDGKIYYNTLDNQTVAVDAVTGREVWKARVGDINKGESMTMAPLVVKGKVLVGNSGGEFGVRGWLTALDGKTGKIVWRAYTAGPDKDVLIGPYVKLPTGWRALAVPRSFSLILLFWTSVCPTLAESRLRAAFIESLQNYKSFF